MQALWQPGEADAGIIAVMNKPGWTFVCEFGTAGGVGARRRVFAAADRTAWRFRSKRRASTRRHARASPAFPNSAATSAC